jgi:hypothetical protein
VTAKRADRDRRAEPTSRLAQFAGGSGSGQRGREGSGAGDPHEVEADLLRVLGGERVIAMPFPTRRTGRRPQARRPGWSRGCVAVRGEGSASEQEAQLLSARGAEARDLQAKPSKQGCRAGSGARNAKGPPQRAFERNSQAPYPGDVTHFAAAVKCTRPEKGHHGRSRRERHLCRSQSVHFRRCSTLSSRHSHVKS